MFFFLLNGIFADFGTNLKHFGSFFSYKKGTFSDFGPVWTYFRLVRFKIGPETRPKNISHDFEAFLVLFPLQK